MTTPLSYFEALQDEMTAWRHALHEHPEIAYEEHWTADFVAARLAEFGLEPVRGLGGTGVVARIGDGSGPRIGLRADMDALPVHETTNLPYASKIPGKMHACGHDGHMTMLLAAARYFAEHPDQLEGTVYVIFQPAEENEAGADAMLRDGLFEKFPVDAVFGLHNWPGLEEGRFAGRVGPQMAAFDVFEILISGQGAHAAMPHQGRDMLLVASHLHGALQSIVSRRVDPVETAVVSVTQIHGGDSWNVLPSEVMMRGCTRHFSAAVQDLIEAEMGALCRAAAAGFGVEVRLDYQRRYPATINSAAETGMALAAAASVSGAEGVTDTLPPSMASEDFAFMLQQRPGSYIWLGAGPVRDGGVLHSPTYRFNDAILARGAAWWVEVARAAQRAHAA